MALKVGILGAGHMGHVHANIISKDERVQIVGVADILAKERDELANRIGSKSLPDLESMLDFGIDVLYVTTPNTTHVEPTLKALRHDVHVFCEKPFATSLEEANKLVEVAKKSKAVYQGGHNRRFAPVYRFVKNKIEEGFTPFLSNIKKNDGDLMEPSWLSNKKKTGGFLYETTIHLLDMAMWLMGDVVEVKALAKDNLYPDLVDWGILMRFEKGRIATLSSSGHASWQIPTERVELVGDHSTLITEELDNVIYSKGLRSVWRL